MYSFAFLILYSLNFIYLLRWTNKEYAHSQSCSNLSLLKGEYPQPAIVSSILLLFCGISFLGWIFWGITDNPYHTMRGGFIQAGDNIALMIVGLSAFCACSFGYLLYKFGQIQAIREQREALMDPQEKAELRRLIAEQALEEIGRRPERRFRN